MCLYFLLFNEKYPFIFIGNREENYERPTDQASFWHNDANILAGKDRLYDGTWVGITKLGKFAALTNSLKELNSTNEFQKRGSLVSDFLSGTDDAYSYLKNKIIPFAKNYKPFNLIAGTLKGSFWYYSNVNSNMSNPILLNKETNKIYSLSNWVLDTSWPRAEYGKKKIETTILNDQSNLIENLFEIMCDETNLMESPLISTFDKLSSRIFINDETFGTRSTTIIILDKNGLLRFIERTYDKNNRTRGKARISLRSVSSAYFKVFYIFKQYLYCRT